MSVRLVGVLQLLVAIGAIAAPMVAAGFYFEGGRLRAHPLSTG